MGAICFTFLLAAGIAASVAPGATLSEADVAATEAKYNAHRQLTDGGTWTADFVQAVQSPDLAQPITSAGKLEFESPDMLTLTYTKPVTGQVALVHGKFKQSLPGREAPASSSDLLQSLVRFFHLPPQAWREQFAVTATEDEKLITIHLAAKPGQSTMQPANIEEVIDAATLDPISLEIDFANHTSLKFTFSNWQRNETSKSS
jgi:outer membrane lipoprotein-sorting protein